MSFMSEVYAFQTEYIGLKEIVGREDTRAIEISHRLCNVEGDKGGGYTDEIPWCSAWITFCMVCVNIRRNPAYSIKILQQRKISENMIKELFAFAKVDYMKMKDINTNVSFVQPTWSADSKSWDKWGYEVPNAEAKRGDLLRLTRDGGGHITQMDEDKLGLVFLKCLGGNQSNKVCSSNSYVRSRLVRIRRAKEDLSYEGQTPLPQSTKPTLKRGDSGQFVEMIQLKLYQYGIQLTVDGKYGPMTEAGVKAFQKTNRLAPNGIVDANTWTAMGFE